MPNSTSWSTKESGTSGAGRAEGWTAWKRQDFRGKDDSQLDLLSAFPLSDSIPFLLFLSTSFFFQPSFLLSFSSSLTTQGQRERKNQSECGRERKVVEMAHNLHHGSIMHGDGTITHSYVCQFQVPGHKAAFAVAPI